MEQHTIFCTACGRQITYDPSYQPKFCPGCGSRLMAAPADPAPAPAASALPEEDAIRFVQGETTPPASNAAFSTEKQEPVFTGWLPKGFTGSAKMEGNPDPDLPLILWAYANAQDGRAYFLRREKRYAIDKLKLDGGNPFRTLEAYLDENAAQLLGTNAIRLVKRVLPFEKVEQQMLADQQKRRQQIEAMGQGDFLRYVVQGHSIPVSAGGSMKPRSAAGSSICSCVSP